MNRMQAVFCVAAMLAFTAVMLGCDTMPRPPTPVLTGPETGWTRAPTVFTATFTQQPGGWTTVADFDWGDSSSNGLYGLGPFEHAFVEPRTYVVKCRLSNIQSTIPFGGMETRYGGWSNPCTVNIIPDTLTHPDSICAKVELGHHASWSCVLPNGSAVYLTIGDDNSVYVLEPGTNSCTHRIPVQSDPSCCVASAAGDRVYVANHGSSSISAIRTTDNSVVDTIPLPAAPDLLALLPGDTLLYVSHAAKNQVSVVRLSDDSIVASIAVRDSPGGMTCTPDGQHVYIAGMGNDSLTVVSTLDHSVERTVRVGDRPTSVLFSPSGETAYVACQRSGQVLLFRCSDLVEIDSIELSHGTAQYLLMLPGDRCLYVISGRGYIVRRSDNCVLRTFWFDAPGWPSVLPDGSRLYVPNANVVTVLGPGHR
jgi:YVTN family beta-propeller protein